MKIFLYCLYAAFLFAMGTGFYVATTFVMEQGLLIDVLSLKEQSIKRVRDPVPQLVFLPGTDEFQFI